MLLSMRRMDLVIVDSVRGYFGSEAQNQSRSSCFIFADMGSFYLISRVNELMKHESSILLKFGYNNSLISVKHFAIIIKRTLKDLLKIKNNCYSDVITEVS